MKTVQVTLSRQYYKEVTINVQVEDSLKEDELIDFLSTDADIDNRLEEALAESSLFGGDDEYTFYDEKDNIEELFQHLRGNTDFVEISAKTLKKINKKL